MDLKEANKRISESITMTLYAVDLLCMKTASKAVKVLLGIFIVQAIGCRYVQCIFLYILYQQIPVIALR